MDRIFICNIHYVSISLHSISMIQHLFVRLIEDLVMMLSEYEECCWKLNS